MEELKQILTPQVVMVMMLTGSFTNVLIVGGLAWITWLLAPSIKQFFLSCEKEMKKMNQAVLELSKSNREISLNLKHLDQRLKTIEAILEVKELVKK